MFKNMHIFSYKHDGSIHRVWRESRIIDETDEYLVLYNDKTQVIENDGRSWFSKEPAIVFFYKERWFNVLCILKEESNYYYCNMTSPYVIDNSIVKYIDYDLDLKVMLDMEQIILDNDEFEYHSIIYNYPDKLIYVIRKEMDILCELAKNKIGPFNLELINKYLEQIKNEENTDEI